VSIDFNYFIDIIRCLFQFIKYDINSGSIKFEDLLKSDLNTSLSTIKEIEAAIQPDDGCSIQFTSVSTRIYI
jgi:hypothetical protein